jgi:hypothetical protein
MSPWFVVIIKWVQKWWSELARSAKIYAIMGMLLSIFILALNFFGLLLPSIIPGLAPGLPYVAALMMVFLTPVILVMVAVGWGASDIGQNFFPQKWIEDVDTKKALLIALGLIAADVGLMLIPYSVNPFSNLWLYGLAVLLGSIAILTAGKVRIAAVGAGLIVLMGMTNWHHTTYGNDLLGKVDEYQQIGILDYPSRPAKKLILKVAQTYGSQHAEADEAGFNDTLNKSSSGSQESKPEPRQQEPKKQTRKQPLSYDDAVNAAENAGHHGYQAEEIKARGLAATDGLQLDEKPDASIDASNSMWQSIDCVNIRTKRSEPCVFFDGDGIKARGVIRSTAIRGVPIDPCGISQDDPESSPYEPKLPRYTLMIRWHYKNGGYSKPFSVCDNVTDSRERTAEGLVNSDYFDRFDRTHDEYFGENKGSFKVWRVKNTN